MSPVPIARRGMMLVLSSPSGAGKTTLSRALLARDANLTMSVSMTTRPKRPGEVDGRDYFFTDVASFQREIAAGAFLEHARVFNHHYGTPRAAVEHLLSAGKDVLFDIDWQGTQQLAHLMRDDLVSVFILPPSVAELDRRLRARAQDSAEVVAERMARAADEVSHWAEYDYVIVNNDVEASVKRLMSILDAERCRRTRQRGLAEFVNELRTGR
ncbi:MAG: guanylate kinase [Alphaproteobacteria bacterium]